MDFLSECCVVKFAVIFLLLAIHIHVGFVLSRRPQKSYNSVIVWLLTIGNVVFVHFYFANESPLLRMLALIITTLISMKNVVTIAYYPFGNPLSYIQWLCFTLGWFGMRPNLFEELRLSSPEFNKYTGILLKGISRIVFGALILFSTKYIPDNASVIRFLLVLIALSLILHFGILNIQRWWWNAWGVRVSELFKSPLKSSSLTEFWSRRWNLAFSEMTSLAVFRPLKKYGMVYATIGSFIFSGLLHEMAISLPVMGGFGMPFAYFVLHGILMAAEKSNFMKVILQKKIVGRCWVLIWLLLPLPILFHPEFIQKILTPLYSGQYFINSTFR